MNSSTISTERKQQRILVTAVASVSILVSAVALADRGRGSIRAAGRPAEHVDVRVNAPHPPPAEVHNNVHVDVHVAQPHVDVHAPPAHVEVRRDWDDNDEDPRHFGGFAHGVPVHVVRGERFHELPPHHVDIFFHNIHYFCDDVGIYYNLQPDGQYVAVQPPVGVAITALPPGTTSIVVGPTTFYYLDGVFYVAQGGGFAVVDPPPGIIVPILPAGATQTVINGAVVYQFDGFNYSPSIQDGVTSYTVNPS